MNVELSSAEREFLIDVLKDRLGTMREQVYHADEPRFKDELRASKGVLESVIKKLSMGTPSGKLLH